MSFPNHSFQDPHQSRQFPGPMQPKPDRQMPGVWILYVVFCILVSLFYAAFIGLGLMFILFAEPIAKSDREVDDPMVFVIMGAMFCLVALPFMIAFAAGPLVPKNRFGWIYGLVLIALGLMSGCTLIFSVPLLIFWLMDDIKRYYGMK